MDINRFRKTLGQFATGVSIVISQGPKSLRGMTVNSLTSVSLNPPLVLFCADNQSDTLNAVLHAKRFTVSILNDQQEPLSQQFALSGSQEQLFSTLSIRPGIDQIPYLSDGLAYLDCHVTKVIPAGDHHVIIGHVDNLDVLDSHRQPLIYFRSHYYQPKSSTLAD